MAVTLRLPWTSAFTPQTFRISQGFVPELFQPLLNTILPNSSGGNHVRFLGGAMYFLKQPMLPKTSNLPGRLVLMFFFLRCGSLDDKRYEDTPKTSQKIEIGLLQLQKPWLLGQHQDWKMDGPKFYWQ